MKDLDVIGAFMQRAAAAFAVGGFASDADCERVMRSLGAKGPVTHTQGTFTVDANGDIQNIRPQAKL